MRHYMAGRPARNTQRRPSPARAYFRARGPCGIGSASATKRPMFLRQILGAIRLESSARIVAHGCCSGPPQGGQPQGSPPQGVPRPRPDRHHRSLHPSLQLVAPVPGSTFPIDATAKMPTITARARITGVSPDPTSSTAFTWTVRLRFQASDCPNGPSRTIVHPDIVQTVIGGNFTIPFTRVRGGQLSIMVQATVAGQRLQAQSSNLRIVGTNPPLESIRASLPHDTLRRIARHESGVHPPGGGSAGPPRQFSGKAEGGTSPWPLFSGDKLGGVGIMQITDPTSTDDEVWDWTANVARGIHVFNQKVGAGSELSGPRTRIGGLRQSHYPLQSGSRPPQSTRDSS